MNISELCVRNKCILTSLTRITDFQNGFDIQKINRADWEEGDYVVCRVTYVGGSKVKAELSNGRMMELMEEDLVIGAFGKRHATLEVTGSWEEVGEDGKMQILTGAGLLGKMTSRSQFITSLINVDYVGHVFNNGIKSNMEDYSASPSKIRLDIPVFLFVGTSMSSGKTTSARILVRMLKNLGLTVAAAKLTGAGRYRDILTIKDAGADYIFDFIDAGLSSSICSTSKYKKALDNMLNLLAGTDADVAVVEIGASPLEPYNGETAIAGIKDQIVCTILCASDPYAVLGVMKAFDIKPDIATGPAANTLGGVELIENLCGVKALNMIEKANLSELEKIVKSKLQMAS